MKHIERGKYNNLYGNWKIGKGTRIGSFCDIGGIIGKNCIIQSYVFIPDFVEIEDDCFIGPGAIFLNDKNPPSAKEEWERVLVKKGAKIGGRAVILPGVTIGEGAMIGAGAVVTKDVEAGKTMVGNPAKILIKCPRGYKVCIHCGECPGI